MKTFQWELWQSCNNMCSFCCLGKGNRHVSKERQLKSLSDLKQALECLDYSQFDTLSLIGGEFFQGQLSNSKVNQAFFEIINKICELYKDGRIDSVWITATLTLGDQKDLYRTLEKFEKVIPEATKGSDGLWLCTSWDLEGRFRKKELEATWQHHMEKIANDFSWVKLNTTTILTQKFCEAYLNGDFVPKSFMEKHKTTLAFTQPRIYDLELDVENARAKVKEVIASNSTDEFLTYLKSKIEMDIGFKFFPERKLFRKFLLKLAKEDRNLFENLFDLNREATELHKNYSNLDTDDLRVADLETKLEACSIVGAISNPNCRSASLEQRHVIDYATYCDSNACMICDYEQIKKSL